MNKWDVRFLNLAKEISTWSKDPSTKVGCVAVDNNRRILAQGYNGFPGGINDSEERLNNKEEKYKYVVHAEAACIYNAVNNGISLKNSSLYIYGLPLCSECAKGIISVKVREVIIPLYPEPPKKWKDSWELTKEMLKEAGVNYREIGMKFND